MRRKTVNEAGSLYAAILLRASSFVLSCEHAMRVHSPYSTKSHGGSQMSKEEYQKYVENLKAEKELIALGYRKVTNRFKH